MFVELTLDAVALWPPGNYKNPSETRGPAMYIVAAIFVSIATSSLALRLYSRLWIRRYFGLDDVLIIIGWLASLGVTTCTMLGHRYYGWDRHIWDILPTDFPHALKVLYFVRIFWGIATSTVRLSICVLFFRLLDRIGVVPSMFKKVLIVFTATQIGMLLVYIFAGIFPCQPIRAYWTLNPIPGQKCHNEEAYMKSLAVLNTVSEFLLAAFPIVAVHTLHIDRQQRRTVIGVLSLGFIVGLAGCFRTFFLWKSMSAPNLDMSWWADPHFITSEVEVDLAITCACVAPLRPLFSYLARKMRGLPSRLPTIGGKRPSLSTYASKRTDMDYDFQPSWSMPRPQCFDLEGLPCDGYGYTVVISGPVRKRSRLRRRKSIVENEVPFLRRPAPVRGSAGSRLSQREDDHEKHVKMDIATVKEINVRTSHNWPRSTSQDTGGHIRTQSSTSGNHVRPGGKAGGSNSWFNEV